jgi:peptidoglycan/LPS O-acetylase OafA/YrhL
VRHRYRNFDTLRLVAAAAVLLTHAYYVVDGGRLVEPFAKLYGSRFELGEIGVYVFFVISGFLITGSFTRRRSTSAYLVKRVLRIFPGLIVCAAICAFVLGAIFTTLPLHRYFDSRGPTHYFLFTSILWRTADWGLPGVNFSNSGAGPIVNGSVWTLGPEFCCYLAVAALGLIGLLRWGPAVRVFRVVRWPLAVGTIVFLIGAHNAPERLFAHGLGNDLAWLALYFAAGSLLFFVYQRWRPPTWAVVACALGLVIDCIAVAHFWPTNSTAPGILEPDTLFALLGSVVVIHIGTSTRWSLGNGARYGDMSYGIYLYGWPIEQVVRHLLGSAASPLGVFALALPAAATAGWFSWHLIEKRMLALAPRITRWIQTPVTALRTASGLRGAAGQGLEP